MLWTLGARYVASTLKMPLMCGLLLGVSTCGFGIMHQVKSSIQTAARQEVLLDVIAQEAEESERVHALMDIVKEEIHEVRAESMTANELAEEEFTFEHIEQLETTGDGVCDYYDILPPFPQ